MFLSRPMTFKIPELQAYTMPGALGESLRAIVDPELRDCLSALAAAVAASEGPPRIGATSRPRPTEGNSD